MVGLSYVKLLLIQKKLNLWHGNFILVPSTLGETHYAVKLILNVLIMQDFPIKKEWGSRPWEGYFCTVRMDYGDLALGIDLLVPLSYQIPCHLLRKPCLLLTRNLFCHSFRQCFNHLSFQMGAEKHSVVCCDPVAAWAHFSGLWRLSSDSIQVTGKK